MVFLFLLQLWRPFFFLTDDSLILYFPVWVGVGRDLWAGQDPWVSMYLFGGNYRLNQDAMFNGLWHPVTWLIALLEPTFLRNAMVDLMAMGNVLLAVTGFRWMSGKLMEAGLFRVSSRGAMFLSLSYGFSFYALHLGSSGLWYLANVAALPWMVGACWEKRANALPGF
ncbi:MAG: hypothetical protein HC904_10080 [Blastochloris sp.]|nr:hypothetical protein [Blastochloris sp.]